MIDLDIEKLLPCQLFISRNIFILCYSSQRYSREHFHLYRFSSTKIPKWNQRITIGNRYSIKPRFKTVKYTTWCAVRGPIPLTANSTWQIAPIHFLIFLARSFFLFRRSSLFHFFISLWCRTIITVVGRTETPFTPLSSVTNATTSLFIPPDPNGLS